MNNDEGSSQRVLVTFAVFMAAVAALSVLSLLGDLGWVEDATTAAFGVLLLAWFALQLQERAVRSHRGVLWCGFLAGLVMLAASGISALVQFATPRRPRVRRGWTRH